MVGGVSFCQIPPVLQREGGSTWLNMARSWANSAIFCTLYATIGEPIILFNQCESLVPQVLPLPLLNIALQALHAPKLVVFCSLAP